VIKGLTLSRISLDAFNKDRLWSFLLGGSLIVLAQLWGWLVRLAPTSVAHWIFESIGATLFLTGLVWLLALRARLTWQRFGVSLLICLFVGLAYSALSMVVDPLTIRRAPLDTLNPEVRAHRVLFWIISGAMALLLIVLGTYQVAKSDLISPFRNKLIAALGLNVMAASYVTGEYVGLITPSRAFYLRETWLLAMDVWVLPLLAGAMLLGSTFGIKYDTRQLLRTLIGWIWLPILAFLVPRTHLYQPFWFVLSALIAMELIRNGQPLPGHTSTKRLGGAGCLALGIAVLAQGTSQAPVPQLGILLLLSGLTLLLFARTSDEFHGRKGIALHPLGKQKGGLVIVAGRELEVQAAKDRFDPGDGLAVGALPEGEFVAIPLDFKG